MLEFHDKLNQKWMVGFKNFKEVGFVDDNWHDYLESLIKTDTQSVKVYVKPSRTASRGKNMPPDDPNLVGVYMETVEPRKIAHRIVAVRENIIEELIQDLGAVQLENAEAVRFAHAWIKGNREVAEKTRTLTRQQGGEDNEGGSTPLRDNTYSDVSLLLTNFALDLVKADLRAREDTGALLCIEQVLEKVTKDVDKLLALDKKLAIGRLPQALLEELCYRGLTEGATGGQGGQSNFLKLSQNVLQTRFALAMGSVRVLESLNRENKNYYRVIKEHGGFAKFADPYKKKPELRIVNLQEEAAKEAAEAMASRARQGRERAAARTREKAVREEELEVVRLVEAAASWASMQYARKEEAEESIFGGGSIGPIMM
jgi:hypothetical protein